MTRYHVSSSGRIPAAPARVYAVLADYRQHHPRIVPPEYFRKLEVLEGGVGAGTRTRVEMRLLGQRRVFEHVISEPEPGRVLREADPDGSNATTFLVDPIEGGAATHLTISTELPGRPGIVGALERKVVTWTLQRVYRKEIVRVADYVARQGAV
jgi:uncharacterized protein YndB with AHSA1/START domain